MEKFIRYFAENKLVVNILVILIVLGGAFSLMRVKQDHMPNVESHFMMVHIAYPGASPEDVEMNVVIPVEEELENISGIDEFNSVAFENGASITVNLDEGLKDPQAVKDEIFRRISISNISGLPSEVDEINVIDFSPTMFTVFSISVTAKKGYTVEPRELFYFTDRLKDELKKVDGVGEIEIDGYREREIHIVVNPNKMEEYYVSLNSIVSAINTRNTRSTGGSIDLEKGEHLVVTDGIFHDPMQVGEVIVRSNFGEKRVRVKDIAQVVDDFEEENIRFRVNGQNGVDIDIKKKENADIMRTNKNIRTFLKDFESQVPDNMEITVIGDRSRNVSSLLNVVQSNAIIGFILVVVILLFFLDARTSFWTAFGIPISLFLTMIYMYAIDQTLNVITLGAIITVIGMLVDDGIVVADVIFENKRKGMHSVEAAVQGTMRVMPAVTVTIVSTIAAFMPLYTIGGMMGKFISFFPVVISAMLLFSLFEAFVILPNHLAHVRPAKARKKAHWFQPLRDGYERLLNKVLRLRYLLLLVVILMGAAILWVSQPTIRNFVLMYDNSADRIRLTVEAPEEGISLDEMEKRAAAIEEIILQQVKPGELEALQTQTGSTGSSGNKRAYFTINLVPKEQRKRDARAILKGLREEINPKKLKGIRQVWAGVSGGGPHGGAAVDVKVIAVDLRDSLAITEELKSYLRTVPGVTDIDDDYDEGKMELRIELDYAKLASLGLSVSDITRTVRTAYNGVVATSIQTTRQKLDFVVKAGNGAKDSREFLLNLMVPNNQGRLIRLNQVASLRTAAGASQIRHYMGERVISVTADVDPAVTTSAKVNARLVEEFMPRVKNYDQAYLKLGGEAEQTRETMGGVVFAFIMAVFFIYFIMILLFKSLSQPIIIMMTIPFGLLGSLLAFRLHGVPLSFMGIIGMIGLMGVAVNDSVVMIDFINSVFKEHPAKDRRHQMANIARGAKQRLRPVILTTVTTVAGLLPTVYGIGGDAKVIVPVVMALAYGLLLASLLTLFMIPSLYMINLDIRKIFGFDRKRDAE